MRSARSLGRGRPELPPSSSASRSQEGRHRPSLVLKLGLESAGGDPGIGKRAWGEAPGWKKVAWRTMVAKWVRGKYEATWTSFAMCEGLGAPRPRPPAAFKGSSLPFLIGLNAGARQRGRWRELRMQAELSGIL